MKGIRLLALVVVLAASSIARAAGTPEQQCQATRNKTAGKYAACRQSAESKFATSGDTSKYNDALDKCEAKFSSAWQKAKDKATAAGATCLDDPLGENDFQAVIDEHTNNVATALGGGGLTDCTAQLATCSGDLSTCNGDLSSCNSDVSACNGDLATCNSDLAQSQSDLSTCNGSLTTCNGNYATCSGNLSTCNSSLSTCNTNLAVKTAQLAACSNSLSTVNSGTAGQADVLASKTFSSGAGIALTGTMPNNGAVNVTPGASAQAIAAGYHNGAGTIAGDADLVAGNIKGGVNLFGVTGTLVNQPLKTGETTDHGTGSDGNLQKGAARSYADNGDGTITDNTTGLMWEKKSDDGSLHDKDNTYTWTTASFPPYPMTGTITTTFLTSLNSGSGFAGYTDWRIPNANELQTLINYQNYGPALDASFSTGCTANCAVTTCSCYSLLNYWSSTSATIALGANYAWVVNFSAGEMTINPKSGTNYVRAVRGGS